MTTLYRSVLIETTEQAEALPVGTVATHAKGSGMDHAHKLFPPLGHTESLLWVSLTGLVSNAGMVGWTALVPIGVHHDTLCTTNGEVQACRPVLVPVGDVDWILEVRTSEGVAP